MKKATRNKRALCGSKAARMIGPEVGFLDQERGIKSHIPVTPAWNPGRALERHGLYGGLDGAFVRKCPVLSA
jgi:hypothetical protein